MDELTLKEWDIDYDGLHSIKIAKYTGDSKTVVVPYGLLLPSEDPDKFIEFLEKGLTLEDLIAEAPDGSTDWDTYKNTTVGFNVVGISPYAFEGTSVETVWLPDSLEYIGASAFKLCENLRQVSFYKVGADKLKVFFEKDDTDIHGLNFVLCSYKPDKIKEADDKQIKIQELNDMTFAGCDKLMSFRIPANVKKIGNQCFHTCRSLEKITIPDSVEVIGECAFAGCRSLQYIDLPESIREIGSGAFMKCSGISSVKIPKNVLVLEASTFNFCQRLRTVELPDGIKELKTECFRGCGLESITLPESVAKIGRGCFSVCRGLKYINIPHSVLEIGDKAFSDCSMLEAIRFNGKLNELGSYAFYGCVSLRKCRLPEGITKIDTGLFRYCSVLDEVIIPDGVDRACTGSFANCNQLKKVKMPGTIKKIEEGAFQDTDLKLLILPKSMEYESLIDMGLDIERTEVEWYES